MYVWEWPGLVLVYENTGVCIDFWVKKSPLQSPFFFKKKMEEMDEKIKQWEEFKVVTKSKTSKPKAKVPHMCADTLYD